MDKIILDIDTLRFYDVAVLRQDQRWKMSFQTLSKLIEEVTTNADFEMGTFPRVDDYARKPEPSVQ